ncbi:unnamed protein product [Trichogramma brassicae]|uniref:Uncharacterized protein n=1 Tax=Trichogramma brassicae TaxID=86971 RepID=A0A6H5IKT8_9HYME|nr:unnamed protein product [Trichogramma brassicae]
MDQLTGKVCFEKLKNLKEKVKWEIDRERRTFFYEFGHSIRNWKGQLPDLRDIFLPEEIERLLVETMSWSWPDDSRKIIVEFVARSGYKDKPDVGQDGKPSVRRTTPVHRAARSLEHCNREIVNGELFKIYDRFDVNYTDEDGWTHFHVACMAGCDSPLHLALRHQRTDVFESLLRGGADPHSANEVGRTPLLLICQRNARDDYTEILNIYRRDDATARALFELSDEKFHPVQVDAQDKHGQAPLHLAVFRPGPKNSSSLVAYLRRRGANPNLADTMGLTPLHYAITGRDSDSCLAELFLDVDGEVDRTVQVDARDDDGWTPLHHAVNWDSKVAIETLLRRGADANLPSEQGSTPLHVMCEEKCDSDLAEFFFKINDDIQQKVHVDAQEEEGNTPLHLALKEGKKKMAELMLRRGANSNLVNAEGLTALHVLCKYDYDFYDLMVLLFKISREKHQPLKIDAQDNSGRTPLQWAVASLSPDAVEVLLDRGADLSSFVFPIESHFEERIEHYRRERIELKLRMTVGALGVVENLEKGGFELDRGDAITIMNLFAKYKVFEKPADLAKGWCKFEKKAKDIMVKPDLSLFDLVRLRPKQATKLLTYSDYLKFLKKYPADNLNQLIGTCAGHLCETMSRKFFKDWALDPFMELTRCRLPILTSEMIIEELPNEDLRNICLAATRLNS